MISALVILAYMQTDHPSNALREYVSKPQSAFTWARDKKDNSEFRLTSQTWQGHKWVHHLVIQEPQGEPVAKDTAFLVITGDRVEAVDAPFAKALADQSRLPVMTLFDVPNQPLYDLREDDLIAYTFKQYIESGDPNWPLLLPMVNSAVRAMDMVQQETKGAISKFIVTGESKRGWTTWLLATLRDPRVIGIAPVAFDNLDVDRQLKYQVESWGHLSEMLGSYSGAGLISQIETPPGQRLREMVDPIFGVSDVQVPVLTIRGSNDPYWTADATNTYWPKVRPPKGLLILPNEGHDFIHDQAYIQALAEFPAEIRNPELLDIRTEFVDGNLVCHMTTPVTALHLWRAESPNKDFRQSKWVLQGEMAIGGGHKKATVKFAPPDKGYWAYFIEFDRPEGPLTSTIQIVGH
jgi:PhoPQ-activated pathogenicity-related protein